MSDYYSYRINLIQPPRQGSLLEEVGTKEQVFFRVFDNLIETNRIDFKDYGSEHVIFHVQKRNEDIIIWNFARKHDFVKPVAMEIGIEEIQDTEHPFINLIFHRSKQIVLIEYKSHVFGTMDTAKSKLERVFTSQLSPYKIDVAITQITSQKEFWERIAEMERIEDVTFEFNPPNFFGAFDALGKMIKETYEETNFQKLEISVENKEKGLKFPKEVFSDLMKRITSGAGWFKIIGHKKGLKTTIQSDEKPLKTEIENPEAVPTEELEEKFEDIEKQSKDE